MRIYDTYMQNYNDTFSLSAMNNTREVTAKVNGILRDIFNQLHDKIEVMIGEEQTADEASAEIEADDGAAEGDNTADAVEGDSTVGAAEGDGAADAGSLMRISLTITLSRIISRMAH